MASPTSPAPEGGASTPLNPPRIRQVGAQSEGRGARTPLSSGPPKERDLAPNAEADQGVGQAQTCLATSPDQGYSLNLLFSASLHTDSDTLTP